MYSGCHSQSFPSALFRSVAKLGIAAISPRSASVMQTPEGMTAGWTATQVHAAYPSFSLSDTHQQDGGPQISVPQNSPQQMPEEKGAALRRRVGQVLIVDGLDDPVHLTLQVMDNGVVAQFQNRGHSEGASATEEPRRIHGR